MEKDEFKDLLKKAGLSQKEFSELAGVGYATVRGWGSTQTTKDYVERGKSIKAFPPWVASWIENYMRAEN